MKCNLKRYLVAVLLLLLVALQATDAQTTQGEDSKVLRFTLPEFVHGKYDAVVTLYHRKDQFHMGYVQLPTRDNIVHRIDVTPSPPIAFVDKNGKEIDVPKAARGYYSYKNKDFVKYKNLYNKKEIDIAHTAKIKPVKLDGDRLIGMIDIKINQVDTASNVSRSGSSLVYRLDINASIKDGKLAGNAVAWMYGAKDDDYGKGSKKTTYKITGQWIKDHWQAKQDTEYAKGKDWPMAHGPNLTGSAIPTDAKLVNTLHDAKLLWVADMPIGAGRGGGLMRGDFCMYPIAWTTLDEAGYGGPIMADNKVFAYVPSIDLEATLKHPALKRNPYYRLGADPRLMKHEKPRDTVYAFDAQTGRLLWEYHGKPGSATNVGGKGGKASIPCYYKGKLYIRVGHGILCLDAKTGEKIWKKGGEENVGGYGLYGAPSDASVTVIGGSLVFTIPSGEKWTTVGLDPKDGALKWMFKGVGGGGADMGWPSMGVPGKYVEDGKEYLVLGRSKPSIKRKDKKRIPPENFMLVDPVDGRVLWESELMGYNDGQIIVEGNIAIGNVVRGLHDKGKLKSGARLERIGGVQISTKGAKLLWTSDVVQPATVRQMAIVNNGVYYNDSRTSKYTANNIKTGKLYRKRSAIYNMSNISHNWSWQIASNDRVFTEGLLMYSTADQGFELLPGRLSNSVSGGYLSPTKPAIADGRLIFRMGDKIACYDLRMSKEAAATEVIKLTAEKSVVTGDREDDIQIRIRKRGDKLISIAGKAPAHTSADMRKAVSWGPQDWSAASHWRSTIPHDITLTADSLKGKAKVRLGYQYEPFTFDLKREGDSFTGTYTRTVKAFDKPIKSSGDVVGPIVTKEDGSRYFIVYLVNAGCSVGSLRGDRKPHAGVYIVISVDQNDKVTAISSCAGRMNQMTYEVETHALSVKGNTVKGEVTIITHDDRYGDLDITQAKAEKRSIGEGGAIAMKFRFESTGEEKKDPKTGETKLENKGKFTGTIGVPWQRTGKITGQLEKEVTD